MWLGCRVRHIVKAHSAEMAVLLLIHSHRHLREDLWGGMVRETVYDQRTMYQVRSSNIMMNGYKNAAVAS
jgi:hypothetical protein